MTCIVLVGPSGAGKSTIATALTGKTDITVSKGYKSCTKFSSLYYVQSGLYTLDTRGILDSQGKGTRDIIDDLVKVLSTQNIKKIKILLCCTPSERTNYDLKQVLNWINKIDRKNIWKSVLGIVKKGDDPDDFLCVSGYVKKELHVNTKIPSANITLLDNLKKSNRNVIYAKTLSKNERFKQGLLYKKEYKSWLINYIGKVGTCSISYTKEYYHNGSRSYSYVHTDEYRMHKGVTTGLVTHNILTLGLSAIAMEATGIYEHHRYWHCCEKRDRYAQGCSKRFDGWSCCSGGEYSSGCCSKWVVDYKL